ncbi:MAG TPA: hypothetical protein VGB38_08835 [bacterium]
MKKMDPAFELGAWKRQKGLFINFANDIFPSNGSQNERKNGNAIQEGVFSDWMDGSRHFGIPSFRCTIS